MNLINSKLLKEELSSKKWIALLETTLFIIMTTLMLIIYTSNGTSNSFASPNVCAVLLVAFSVIFICTLFLSGITIFNFFHGKSKVDFYHNLPIKRETMFFTKYVAGIILTYVPYIIFSLIAILMSSLVSQTINPNMYIENYARYHYNILILSFIKVLILATFGYTFTVFFSTVTGKTIAHIFTIFVSFFAPILILVFTNYFFSISINSAISADSAFTFFLGLFTLTANTSYSTMPIPQTFFIILLTIALLYFSIRNYKNYKSENSEMAITSKWLSNLFVYLASFVIALIFVAIFVTMNNMDIAYPDYMNDVFIITIVLVFIFTIFKALIQSFVNGGFSKKVLSFKSLSFIIVISIAYSSISFLDVLNRKNYVPNINDIVGVRIKDDVFNEKENIELIQMITTESVNFSGNALNGPYAEYTNSEYATSEDAQINYLNLTYYLKNGKQFNRTYHYVASESVMDKMTELYTSEEYKNDALYALDVLSKNASTVSSLDINIYSPNGYNYFDYFIQSNQREEFLNALIKDIKEDDNFGNYNFANYGLYNFSVNPSVAVVDNVYLFIPYIDKTFPEHYLTRNLKIKSTYKNSLELLYKYNLTNLPDEDPDKKVVYYSISKDKLDIDKALSNGKEYLKFNDIRLFAQNDDVFYDNLIDTLNSDKSLFYDINVLEGDDATKFMETVTPFNIDDRYLTIKLSPDKQLYRGVYYEYGHSRDLGVFYKN